MISGCKEGKDGIVVGFEEELSDPIEHKVFAFWGYLDGDNGRIKDRERCDVFFTYCYRIVFKCCFKNIV